MDFWQRLGNRVLDWLGFLLLALVGALLATALFFLRIIPDREREAAAKAREAANRRADSIRTKIAAAKAVRDAAASAAAAAAQAAGDTLAGKPAVGTANEYITGKR